MCHVLFSFQGSRFGGAIDAAARQFSEAFDAGQSPSEFVSSSRAAGRLIMGIGHRIKSVFNPDTRVTLLAEFARANFPATPLIDFAFQVEKLTTAKVALQKLFTVIFSTIH